MVKSEKEEKTYNYLPKSLVEVSIWAENEGLLSHLIEYVEKLPHDPETCRLCGTFKELQDMGGFP